MGNLEKLDKHTDALRHDDITIKYGERCAELLVGKTIKSVRYLYNAEQKDMGWYKKSLVIYFTDETYMYSSADNEGNDAGAYFTSIKGLEVIPTI